MLYVDIPHTELRVSRLCLGSTDIGGKISAPDSFALLDEFVRLGGNFIDTAHVYSDWIPGTRSRSEKTIGQWLTSRGIRGQLIIGTKGAHPALETMQVSRLSRADIVGDLTESLDYLQTDWIDLYWLHRDDSRLPVAGIIEVLNEQVAAGKIRYFGASNWSAVRIQAAQDYADSHGLRGFVANQAWWSLAACAIENNPDQTVIAFDKAALDFHRRTGMAVVAYSSQAHGFFSKLESGAPIGGIDRGLFDGDVNRQRLERIKRLAQKYDAQINDIVLAYLIAQPFPTIPIIGSKRLDHLQSSMNALRIALSSEELAYLEG